VHFDSLLPSTGAVISITAALLDPYQCWVNIKLLNTPIDTGAYIFFKFFLKKYKNVKYLFIEFIFKIRNKISNFRIKYFNLIYAEIGKGTEVYQVYLILGSI